MALSKELEVRNTGINCTYRRISRLISVFDPSKESIQVFMEGYLDKTNRVDGKSPIDSYNFRIDTVEYNKSFKDGVDRTGVYTFLKTKESEEDTLNPFLGATDA